MGWGPACAGPRCVGLGCMVRVAKATISYKKYEHTKYKIAQKAEAVDIISNSADYITISCEM